jgi:hypothetical protein
MRTDALATIRAAGITLSVEDGNLIARPKAAVTDEARRLIRENKTELMRALRSPWKPPTRGFDGYGPGALSDTELARQAKDMAGENVPSIAAHMARLSAQDLDRMTRQQVAAATPATPGALPGVSREFRARLDDEDLAHKPHIVKALEHPAPLQPLSPAAEARRRKVPLRHLCRGPEHRSCDRGLGHPGRHL